MDESEQRGHDEQLPRLGKWVGRYQLVRRIGEGAMGVVFEARHKLMDSAYALKFLQEDLAAQPVVAERFLREARIAGRIDNPHVVRVFDVSDEGGLPYMVMELLQGETLEERRSGPALSGGEISEIMLQVLDGVAAAHRLDVVHRDLKPANIMLTRNDQGQLVAKVLDFGLAKLLDGGASAGVTEPGTVLGTPHYMPPEQAFGERVDQRADVFALGVIFFELIAGMRPVDGEAPAEIAAAYQRGRVRRLEQCVPSVDRALAHAIHKALAPRAEERFNSAVEFYAAVRHVTPVGDAPRAALDDEWTPAEPVLAPAAPHARPWLWIGLAVALGIALTAALLIWAS